MFTLSIKAKYIFFISILCFGSKCVTSSSKGRPTRTISKENSYLPSNLPRENTLDDYYKERLKNKLKGSLNTQLDKAIEDNDLELVKSLLAAGADINNSESYSSPLEKAISKNNVELVQLLLNAGARVTFNCIRLSRLNSNKSILEILAMHLGLHLKKNPQGLSPLHWASQFGYTGIIRALVDSDRSLDYNEVDPIYGFTPLHYASRTGNREIVEMLLDKGADRTAVSKYGLTPLMLAMANEHNHLTELLSPDGFDRSTPESESLKQQEECPICFEQFDPEDGENPIVVVSCNGKHCFHKICIDQWYNGKESHKKSCPKCRGNAPHYDNINTITDHAYCQLLLTDSIKDCNKASFDTSLKYGADPNAPDENGDYPLVLAINAPYSEFTIYAIISLIKYGACIKKTGIDCRNEILCGIGAFDNTILY